MHPLQCTVSLYATAPQVLLSFISGRGAMVASFMGKGVTSRASLSLCHLLHSVGTLSPPEVWRDQPGFSSARHWGLAAQLIENLGGKES